MLTFIIARLCFQYTHSGVELRSKRKNTPNACYNKIFSLSFEQINAVYVDIAEKILIIYKYGVHTVDAR